MIVTPIVGHSHTEGWLLTARIATWRTHLAALAFAIVALLVIFAADVADMARIWWTSSTYQHCLVILPLVAWLIAQRRHDVMSIAPRPYPLALILLVAAATLWLIGSAAGVALVRHLALVLMIQASVLALLGPAVVRAMLFPLFYFVFLVPFGEEFVPALQTLTAKIVIALIHLSGLPAQIDGVFITTRAGWFEVAEACSGVNFLIAMIAFGALVANLGFRCWRRRAAFMVLCVAAPILANGIRAFATIYAAHLTSAEQAAGFDHIVYGWFFFAFVMALVTAIGWRFFDRGPAALAPPPDRNGGTGLNPLLITLAIVGIALAPAVWSRAASAETALPHAIALPEVAGWAAGPASAGYLWRARFDGADHRLFGYYGNTHGNGVDLAVALYAAQGEGREIVGYGQGALDPASKWAWTADLPAPPGARAIRMLAPGRVERVAVTFYIVGGQVRDGPRAVKLATLVARLSGGDQRAATVIVSAPSRAAVDAFLADLGRPAALTNRLFAQAEGR